MVCVQASCSWGDRGCSAWVVPVSTCCIRQLVLTYFLKEWQLEVFQETGRGDNTSKGTECERTHIPCLSKQNWVFHSYGRGKRDIPLPEASWGHFKKALNQVGYLPGGEVEHLSPEGCLQWTGVEHVEKPLEESDICLLELGGRITGVWLLSAQIWQWDAGCTCLDVRILPFWWWITPGFFLIDKSGH